MKTLSRKNLALKCLQPPYEDTFHPKTIIIVSSFYLISKLPPSPQKKPEPHPKGFWLLQTIIYDTGLKTGKAGQITCPLNPSLTTVIRAIGCFIFILRLKILQFWLFVLFFPDFSQSFCKHFRGLCSGNGIFAV